MECHPNRVTENMGNQKSLCFAFQDSIFLHGTVTKGLVRAVRGLCSAPDHLCECSGGIYLGFLHFSPPVYTSEKK